MPLYKDKLSNDPWYVALKAAQAAEKAATEVEAAKHPPYIFYFAGKIGHTDWRHSILSLRDVDYPAEDYRHKRVSVLRHALGPNLHYCGPFFVSCDHGCYHGDNSHGVGANKREDTLCGEDIQAKERVSYSCLHSIAYATVIYAWIDSLTAYGSFAELGFARALGKKIWLAWPKPLPDLWFIERLATVTIVAETAELALRELLFTQLHRSFL